MMANAVLILTLLLFATNVRAELNLKSSSSGVDIRAFSSFSSAVSSPVTAGKSIVISEMVSCNNLTVPSNRLLRIDKGGGIVVAAGKTLVVNAMESGLYQVFNGKGLVKLTAGSVTEVYPQWWGASPFAPAVTNSLAIQKSIDSLPKNFGTWTLPPGEYQVEKELVFSKLINAKITFEGQIVTDLSAGISFADISKSIISDIDVRRSKYDWTSDQSAIKFNRYFAHNKISIRSVYGFKYGIYVDANDIGGSDTGIGWNQITLGKFQDNKYGLFFKNSGKGWSNDNHWYGGAFRLYSSTKSSETGSWGVYFDSPTGWIFSDHRFHGPSFEILHNGIKLAGCYNFVLDNPRFEAVDLWMDASSAIALTWIAGYALDTTKVRFGAATRGLTILSAAEYSNSKNKSIVLDDKYGGITFISTSDTEKTRSHLFTDYSNRGGLVYKNYLNTDQSIDKLFSGNGIPATGTYFKNAIVWNSNVAPGEVAGWIASQTGTMGELSGVIGAIDTGSYILAVNDASKIKPGEFISVCDKAAACVVNGAQVVTISETKITISQKSTGNASSAHVMYHGAQWEILPQLGIRGGPINKRPIVSSSAVGYSFFDTTSNKLTIWDGSSWRFADGMLAP